MAHMVYDGYLSGGAKGAAGQAGGHVLHDPAEPARTQDAQNANNGWVVDWGPARNVSGGDLSAVFMRSHGFWDRTPEGENTPVWSMYFVNGREGAGTPGFNTGKYGDPPFNGWQVGAPSVAPPRKILDNAREPGGTSMLGRHGGLSQGMQAPLVFPHRDMSANFAFLDGHAESRSTDSIQIARATGGWKTSAYNNYGGLDRPGKVYQQEPLLKFPDD